MEGVGSWIASQGTPVDAGRWVSRLAEAYGTLACFPERCPLAPDDPGEDIVIRHLIAGEYRVLFTVQAGVVVVLQVRHGRMQPATKEDLAPALGELGSLLADR